MDPSRRRQILSQQAMPLSASLSSGQAYYTLESLEGATSLPFLKPAPPASLPRRESFPPLERDALLRLDAQTRALLADRETLDARARLLAAERAALLRNLPGGAIDQRMYADGLQALDARARVPLDTRARDLLDNGRVFSHGLDVRPGAPLSDNRGLSHGLDTRPRDPLQLGAMNISRPPPVVGGIAPKATEYGPLSELLRGRELGVGAPFLPAADPTLKRDIGRAEIPDVRAQSARLFANGSREPAANRSAPAEANNVKKQAEQNKVLSNSKADKIMQGWCAVCKIDCHNTRSLGIHVNGKKHKAVVERLQGNRVIAEAVLKAVNKPEVNSVPSTSEADKKRASDEKPETSQSAKRLKASTPVVTSNTPTTVATDIQKAEDDSEKAEPTGADLSREFCEVCNIITTGKTNLENHLKGKRHATRVRKNLKILRRLTYALLPRPSL